MKVSNLEECNLDSTQISKLIDVINSDIEQEQYDGVVLLIARNGKLALHEAIGYADRANKRILKKDDVFSIFSVAKSLTAISVLMQIERGKFSLNTPVADIIPEFITESSNKNKKQITIFHLLTHTSGVSSALPDVPFELLGNLSAVAQAICKEDIHVPPGQKVHYSSTAGYALLGEIIRRVDEHNRSFSQIIIDEILRPLGMQDTSFGLRPDLVSRKIPVIYRDKTRGLFPTEFVEIADKAIDASCEAPAGFGAVSNVLDFFKFAQMLLNRGTFNNTKILSNARVDLATTNQTGLKSNNLWDFARQTKGWPEFPAFLGLGFFLRGTGTFPTPFGLSASEKTFGALGLGSTMFWVDPVRDLIFVFFSSGLMEESRNIERLQRISDLVITAVR